MDMVTVTEIEAFAEPIGFPLEPRMQERSSKNKPFGDLAMRKGMVGITVLPVNGISHVWHPSF